MITLNKTIAQHDHSTDKWSISFDVIRTNGIESYISAECTCVFDSADEAHEGGKRAVIYYDRNGRFPNMCKVF